MTDAGLEDGLLGLRIEEVQPLHVDRQPNTVTDADLERGIDTRDEVVRTYLAVQVLVRAQYLEHLTLSSMAVSSSETLGRKCSGRMPRMPRATPGASGSLSSKPDAFASWSEIVTGKKFMRGLPMKPATYMFTGWS